MWLKVAIGIIGLLVLFLAYVATRDGHFRYERSGLIKAPPEKIFPYLKDFTLASQWSPYEKADPAMTKRLEGAAGEVGSSMTFEGTKSGSGRLEILKIVPNEAVEIRLTMTKPFRAENMVYYRLTREGDSTRFSWSMGGDGGFMGKLVAVLVNCEKMVAGQFSEGIETLKALVESKQN